MKKIYVFLLFIVGALTALGFVYFCSDNSAYDNLGGEINAQNVEVPMWRHLFMD